MNNGVVLNEYILTRTGFNTSLTRSALQADTIITSIYCTLSNKTSCATLYLFHFLFLAVLGLQCCADFSLALADEGYSLVAACGVLIVVASLIVEHGL